MESSTIVEVSGLHKIFQQGKVQVHALRGVDLDIARGEFTAICGPSGSGKTTLLNLIGALDSPTSGKVRVAGRDLADLSAGQLARLRLKEVGFVFQAYNLVPVLSAWENAEFVMLLQGVPAAERRRRLDEVFSQVGLTGLERRRPSELSGGQQQRVAVARAVAARPALVLADEPTANLDSESGAALLDMMRELNETRQVTFVFSTHDQRVMDRANRLIELRDGVISSDERQEPPRAAGAA
ncbi:MAG: ABC transporter ATP-binding protein [Polyangia bacterium]|jgi:putative ABC transport system ATP-binding protein|nr:ABC transporter ATP-binding protein [Polyangia bacterium]